jgi:ribosomal protein S18 acetylase RimI-like enzyme
MYRRESDNMIDQTHFLVRAMSLEDSRIVASLHYQIFPDYFLTQLGIGVLEILYAQLAKSHYANSFVCLRDDIIVGFVAGLTALGNFKFGLMTQYWPRILLVLIPRIISHPKLLIPLLHRLILSVPRIKPLKPTEADPIETYPNLLSIGVAPEVRGTPVARLLVVALADRYRLEGYTHIVLHTLSSNIAGNRFFQKVGFQFIRSTGTKRSSNIYVMDL